MSHALSKIGRSSFATRMILCVLIVLVEVNSFGAYIYLHSNFTFKKWLNNAIKQTTLQLLISPLVPIANTSNENIHFSADVVAYFPQGIRQKVALATDC